MLHYCKARTKLFCNKYNCSELISLARGIQRAVSTFITLQTSLLIYVFIRLLVLVPTEMMFRKKTNLANAPQHAELVDFLSD